MHATPGFRRRSPNTLSCLTGPTGTIALTGPRGLGGRTRRRHRRGSRNVARAEASDYVAGSDRRSRTSASASKMTGTPPQFSLGKSFAGLRPHRTCLVTLDEIGLDTPLRCDVGSTTNCSGCSTTDDRAPPRSSAAVAVCSLYPGDLIFTGTPSARHGPKPLPLLNPATPCAPASTGSAR